MFKKLRAKIESNRASKNFIWKCLVFIKDILYASCKICNVLLKGRSQKVFGIGAHKTATTSLHSNHLDNVAEFKKIQKMAKTDLKKYIKTWNHMGDDKGCRSQTNIS